jgi:hypothetical protein
MNREDIIQMAQKAGFVWLGEYHSNLEDFAKLVAQHEREACATMSDWILKEGGGTWGDAIRARGNT